MRTHARIVGFVSLLSLVMLAGMMASVSADAKRFRVCVFPDRADAVAVIVDDFKVNETVFDEAGVQYIWLHGPAGSFQLHFSTISQIEVVKWLGKDPSRDDFTRYSVKVTGIGENESYWGTIDVRVWRGLVGKTPWYFFPVTQKDRGSKFWRVTFGMTCAEPTIPAPVEKPAAPPAAPLALPKPPAEPLPPPAASEPDVDQLGDVFYAYDKWDLTEASRDTLSKNAEWMRRWPTARLRIEGQADPRGTNEYNFPLAQHRADAAKDYLVSLGIAPDRLETVTMGKTNLVCTVQGEPCWQRNRRAHFVLLSK